MGEKKSGAVHPLVAVLVIALFGSLLLAWLWTREQVNAVAEPLHMAVQSAQSVLVRYDGALYRVDAQGKVSAALPLPDAASRVGFAIDPDSRDIFIYRDTKGLWQCAQDVGHCRPFVTSLNPQGPGRLYWDVNGRQLAVTDSSNHRLSLFDAGGHLLKTFKDLRYPNGMAADKRTLLVADTNHHRVVRLDLDRPESLQTAFNVEMGGEYRWPTDLARVGAEYWVLVGDNRLGNQRLYRFDAHGQVLGRIATRLDDILMIAPLGSGALVADHASRTLWRLGAQGEPLDQVLLPGMAEAQQELAYWSLWRNVLLVVFVVALLAGLAFAWWYDRDRLPRGLTGDDLSEQRSSQSWAPRGEAWLRHGLLVRYRYLYLAGPAFYFVVSAVALWMVGSLPWKLLAMLAVLGAVLTLLSVTAFWVLHYISRSGVGVHGPLVLLKTPGGQVVVGSGPQVAYSPSMLIIDGVVMPLGTAVVGLYDREQMRQWVAPQLSEARQLTGYQVLVEVWRHRFWPLILIYALITLMSLAGIVFIVSRGMS
ncbi:hypothetical protein A11A3_03624 [Alcanivorax hongdengensis A-11-3]|uniref:NHL repeat containing protein n=1 Tax=Alcanivorax hongdengensis A-11-3 TaxID=1177179 RepID=L0WHW9_9GAMM|nr:hypothetical protein [Alcanivorax hongdengensis]EKF75415.1 hypothetical protein A11A3_03624 [Alcanivorax hongdengensis A-11-3]